MNKRSAGSPGTASIWCGTYRLRVWQKSKAANQSETKSKAIKVVWGLACRWACRHFEVKTWRGLRSLQRVIR
jgi:hypothetical protein